MPKHRALDDDDPEIQDVKEKGGLSAGTLAERKKIFKDWCTFVKGKTGLDFSDLIISEGWESKVDNLLIVFFVGMEVDKQEQKDGKIVNTSRKPKSG